MMLSGNYNGKIPIKNGTDITLTLKNAISKSKKVTLPAGTFRLSSSISLPNGCTLEGSGSKSTIIESAKGVDINVLNVSNVTIKGLKLSSKGGHSSIKVQAGIPKDKKSARPVRNIIIQDIFIDNLANVRALKHGIYVRAWANEDIENVKIRNCKVIGAYGEHHNKGVDNCYVGAYEQEGTGTVRNVEIDNCHFSIAGRQNLSIAGKGKNKPINIRISNCVFENSSLGGVDLEEATDVVISDCQFKNNGIETRYFNLNTDKKSSKSSMRSGLVAHRSNARIKNCTFTNCFYGYTSVNTQKQGLLFENCTFKDAPIGNGSFAGMATTKYIGCTFSGEKLLASIYNGSFIFEKCHFSGAAPRLINVSGGGLKRRTVGKASFNSCEFVGNSKNTLFEFNYETIDINNSKFDKFESIISSSGNNRQNSIQITKSSFSDVGSLGFFSPKTIQSLSVVECDFVNINSLWKSETINGSFEFSKNSVKVGSNNDAAAIVKCANFADFKFENNTIEVNNSDKEQLIDLKTNKHVDYPTKGIVVCGNKVECKENKGNLKLLSLQVPNESLLKNGEVRQNTINGTKASLGKMSPKVLKKIVVE